MEFLTTVNLQSFIERTKIWDFLNSVIYLFVRNWVMILCLMAVCFKDEKFIACFVDGYIFFRLLMKFVRPV